MSDLPSASPGMSHLERERQTQMLRNHVKRISPPDLRKLRAWLLDVVQGSMTQYADLAKLRGEVVHATVEADEAGGFFYRLVREDRTDRRSLDWVARFPDLEPPEDLRSSEQR